MTRGGKRKGAGAPKLPENKKRQSLTVRLLPHQIEYIKKQRRGWATAFVEEKIQERITMEKLIDRIETAIDEFQKANPVSAPYFLPIRFFNLTDTDLKELCQEIGTTPENLVSKILEKGMAFWNKKMSQIEYDGNGFEYMLGGMARKQKLLDSIPWIIWDLTENDSTFQVIANICYHSDNDLSLREIREIADNNGISFDIHVLLEHVEWTEDDWATLAECIINEITVEAVKERLNEYKQLTEYAAGTARS